MLPSLPAEKTTFVGRARDIRTLSDLLMRRDVRTVTLTGPGGIGKSRLALKLATVLHPHFEHGARYVALESISDPRLVRNAIVNSLQLKSGRDNAPEAVLVAALATAEMLLVLDNFEQVMEAAPDISALLTRCPRLKVLTTSRTPLSISGEHSYPVAPLALPDERNARSSISTLGSSEAVRLFVQRATAAAPGFALTEDNASDIATICRRLDGLPLAIELAAAHIRMFPPRTLLSRSEADLPLPLSGPRDSPERQHSLHNTISWSYDLLTPPEQALFRCLSVFIGDFGLDAAEAVCGMSRDPADDPDGPRGGFLPDLGSLIASSLVKRGTAHREARYSMLGTLRAYGLKRLEERQEANQVRDTHARWQLELAERLRWGWMTDNEQVARLQLDHPDMLAALEYFLVNRDSDRALRLSAALAGFWYVQTQFDLGTSFLRAALDVAPDTPCVTRGRALVTYGMMLSMKGAWRDAQSVLTEGMAILERTDDVAHICLVRLWCGAIANFHMEFAKAERQLEAALELAKTIPDARICHAFTARILTNLGVSARGLNDLERAIEHHESAIRINREHGFTLCLLRALYDRGEAASDQQDFTGAMAYFRECLAILGESGDRRVIVDVLQQSAIIAATWEQPDTAARFLGAADTLSRPYGGFAPPEPDFSNRQRALVAIRTQRGDAETQRLLADGMSLPLETVLNNVQALAPTPAYTSPDAVAETDLSSRELEVLQMLVGGLLNREIAETLSISVRTVEAHVARIRQKLGVSSRTAAVYAAIATGIITPDAPADRESGSPAARAIRPDDALR